MATRSASRGYRARAITVEVLLDGPWHARQPVNDDEIIERALAAGDITGQQALLAAADFRDAAQGVGCGPEGGVAPRPSGNGG